jgi:hypothetical protein
MHVPRWWQAVSWFLGNTPGSSKAAKSTVARWHHHRDQAPNLIREPKMFAPGEAVIVKVDPRSSGARASEPDHDS